jgi:predicted DNA-binding transcriptional regulator YafY
MRYQLNLPIEFDYARGGYCFTKSVTDLPLFQLTESELVSVFVAQKALEACRGTPFEQPLERERNWHPSQRLQELADGNLEVTLTLNSLEEVVPWVLSWGRQCEVVRPARLRKKVSRSPSARRSWPWKKNDSNGSPLEPRCNTPALDVSPTTVPRFAGVVMRRRRLLCSLEG